MSTAVSRIACKPLPKLGMRGCTSSFLKCHHSISKGAICISPPHCPERLKERKSISTLRDCESPKRGALDQSPGEIPEELLSISLQSIVGVRLYLPCLRNFFADIERLRKDFQPDFLRHFDIVGLCAKRRQEHTIYHHVSLKFPRGFAPTHLQWEKYPL